MKAHLWKVLVVAGMLAPWDVRGDEALAEVAPAPEVESGPSVVVFKLGQLRSEDRVVASLVWLAQRLEETPGVTSTDVRLGRRDVRVTYDERTSVPEMVRRVEELGYHAKRDVTSRLADTGGGSGGGAGHAPAGPLR